MDKSQQPVRIWVLANHPDQGCFERLGDASRLAQVMGCRVGIAFVPIEDGLNPAAIDTAPLAESSPRAKNRLESCESFFEHGADLVRVLESSPKRGAGSGLSQQGGSLRISPAAMARITLRLLRDQPAKLIFVGGDPAAREWGSLLAAETGWEWISPVLMTRYRAHQLQITRLDTSGRRACTITSSLDQPLILAMRDGVAEALPRSTERKGVVETILIEGDTGGDTDGDPDFIQYTHIPVDPAQADIRDCKKLISGGRGLGSAAGFDLLRTIASQLDAGVSASRMAVDNGWIEYERQVGQTGKTVQPDLYIACGISGASHHLDGMSAARHVVALNSDPEAPIMKVAHLKLSADLHDVLNRVSEKLRARAGQSHGEGG